MYYKKKLNGYTIGHCRKRVQKSVRLHESVYEYIMNIEGNNFSDKLENLVISHSVMCEKQK